MNLSMIKITLRKKVKGVMAEGLGLACMGFKLSTEPPKARYEVTLVSGAGLDALYEHLIIEYEKPKTFETRDRLARLGNKNETYDDIIIRLIEFYESTRSSRR